MYKVVQEEEGTFAVVMDEEEIVIVSFDFEDEAQAVVSHLNSGDTGYETEQVSGLSDDPNAPEWCINDSSGMTFAWVHSRDIADSLLTHLNRNA